MHQEFPVCELEELGALRIQGADAVRFLQGQLSNDLQRLTPERALIAGYHNPQGRVIALLRLVHLAEADVLAILPRELLTPVAQRLAKFVLRSKVRIAAECADWSISGRVGWEAAAPPPPLGEQRRVSDAIIVCVSEHPARYLEIRPRTAAPPTRPAATTATGAHWRVLEVRAGLPQVYAQTSEQFVAQMLNLDVIGAIAFDKGCYTGQEVIARAHYRGRIKRRLQRFCSRGPLALAPGDGGTLPDGRPFKVVQAARLEDGRCEFLAVAPLPGAQAESAGGDDTTAPVDAESLPLPYRLPD